MSNQDLKKKPSCPYCGSEKLIPIDWGFANWECETCRNNFKSPYYKSKNTFTYNNAEKPRKKTIGDYINKITGYVIISLLIFCIAFAIMIILLMIIKEFIEFIGIFA